MSPFHSKEKTKVLVFRSFYIIPYPIDIKTYMIILSMNILLMNDLIFLLFTECLRNIYHKFSTFPVRVREDIEHVVKKLKK